MMVYDFSFPATTSRAFEKVWQVSRSGHFTLQQICSGSIHFGFFHLTLTDTDAALV